MTESHPPHSDEDWQVAFDARAGELAVRLQGIVEALDDLVVDHLRTAIEHGVHGRPPLDKRLQAARRAVEKAVRTLGSP